jgi:predicted dehydrogenase
MVTNIEKKIYFLHIPVLIGLTFGKLFRLLKFKNPPFFIDNVLGSTQETNCDPKNIIKTYNYSPLDFKGGLNKIYGSKKINVGVVGLGKMGLFHLSILSTFNDVNIVALVDTNKALFSTIKSMGISGNFYNNIEDALENEKVDAFWILTPTFTHLPLIKSLIKNKINVFVEKPVVLNEKQVNELKSYSSNYSAIINVGYVWLFKRTYRKVKEIIESKKMGEILNFEISFKHGEVFGEKKGWMFSKDKSGGGVMMNPGPHVFSLVNLLFGTPKKVNGSIKSIYSTEVDDEADLELTYKGFLGKVFLSWSVKNANIAETLVKINFEKGFLSTDGKEINIVLKNGKKEKINEYDIDPLLENSFNINPDANGDSFYIEDRLFVDSIKTKNKDSINNLDFGLKAESIIFNCYREAK